MVNDHFLASNLFERKYDVFLFDNGHLELKKNAFIVVISNLK